MRTDLTTDLTTDHEADLGSGPRFDLVARALLPVAAVVALVLDAPQVATGGLALLGLAAAAERLVRLRSSNLTDRVLVGVGGVLVAVVLTGVVLGSTPVGLSRTSWVVSLAALSVVALLLAAAIPPRDLAPEARGADTRRTDRRTALRLLPWLAIAGVVVVVAVRMSATSLSSSESPPVQMSFGRVSGTDVQVVVSSSDPVGPLEVRTASEGDEVSYPLFSVTADGSVTTTVSLPTTGRFVISVNYPDQTEPLRTLVLDR